MEKMPIAALKLDMNLYPRQLVDSTHISDLVRACEAGAILPPILVDSGSYRVVDGFHRVNVARRLAGDAAQIEVELRTFASEADMLEAAIARNAAHGRKFAPADRAHAAILAERVGLTDERVAGAMGLTVPDYKNMVLKKIAISPGKKPEKVALKATCRNLNGKTLSKKQMEGNRKAGGMTYLFYVNQVINGIENDIINPEDAKVRLRLEALFRLLEKYLA